MGDFNELLEKLKTNLNNPSSKKKGDRNFMILSDAIDEFSKGESEVIKKFVKDDRFFVVMWKKGENYYVSNINSYFIEFDKYRFNDKNAANFLYKDLVAFSRELSEVE